MYKWHSVQSVFMHKYSSYGAKVRTGAYLEEAGDLLKQSVCVCVIKLWLTGHTHIDKLIADVSYP